MLIQGYTGDAFNSRVQLWRASPNSTKCRAILCGIYTVLFGILNTVQYREDIVAISPGIKCY
ncbi:unnamed protein product [Larinioides sclopetarius]|uniref:Uncharacterized protein n=1 Tax=Larinioides sclopetarius TaxID=280406 RepID=A0AAV1YWN8_9ARAC